MKLLLCLVIAGVSCASSSRPMPARISGPITEVRLDAGEVTGFTITRGTREYPVLIETDRDYGFDLTHLEEHRATGDPVVVELVWRGSDAYARTIVDA